MPGLPWKDFISLPHGPHELLPSVKCERKWPGADGQLTSHGHLTGVRKEIVIRETPDHYNETNLMKPGPLGDFETLWGCSVPSGGLQSN